MATTITVNRLELKKRLTLFPFIKQNMIPQILAYIELSGTENGLLELRGTDQQLIVCANVTAKISDTFSAAVDFNDFKRVITGMKSKIITFTIDDKLTITGEKETVTLPIGQNYPTLDLGTPDWQEAGFSLKVVLDATSFLATNVNEWSNLLKIKAVGDVVEFVSTNGSGLSKIALKLKLQGLDVLVDMSTLGNVKFDAVEKIAWDSDYLYLLGADGSFAKMLLIQNTKFPNYEPIFNRPHLFTIPSLTVDLDPLLVVDDTITFNIQKNTMKLSARSRTGSGELEMNVSVSTPARFKLDCKMLPKLDNVDFAVFDMVPNLIRLQRDNWEYWQVGKTR